MNQDGRRGWTRRSILAGAAAAGAGWAFYGLGRAHGIFFEAGDPAFEVARVLHVGSELQGPVRICFTVETPRGSVTLREAIASPGDRVSHRLTYPFDEVVPGVYLYGAQAMDGRGRRALTAPVEVTLQDYWFGC